MRPDGLRSYLSLGGRGYLHERVLVRDAGETLGPSWLRVTVSNAKASLAGTYHGVSGKHLQAYLDEYDYRFNRRQRPDLIFDRVVMATARSTPRSYAEIVGRKRVREGRSEVA